MNPAAPGRADGLVADAVSVRFDGVHAVDRVDLALSRGEILGLIGPNGAGKTTLVNALTGFQQPSDGRVLVDGQDAGDWAPHTFARRGVARTFQTGRVFARLTVEETVEVGAVGAGGRRREARARVAQALERMDLAAERETIAAALPHGFERRLGIARALATEPRFLLLDEPAAGLDEGESGELVETIARLPGDTGCGVLVIDHDIKLIMSLCSRIQVLDHGSTIAVGSPSEVRRDPSVIEAYLGTAAVDGAESAAAG